MIPYKQLSLADIFRDCQNKFDNGKPAFLSLLEQHIDLDKIIPAAFYSHFYALLINNLNLLNKIFSPFSLSYKNIYSDMIFIVASIQTLA